MKEQHQDIISTDFYENFKEDVTMWTRYILGPKKKHEFFMKLILEQC